MPFSVLPAPAGAMGLEPMSPNRLGGLAGFWSPPTVIAFFSQAGEPKIPALSLPSSSSLSVVGSSVSSTVEDATESCRLERGGRAPPGLPTILLSLSLISPELERSDWSVSSVSVLIIGACSVKAQGTSCKGTRDKGQRHLKTCFLQRKEKMSHDSSHLPVSSSLSVDSSSLPTRLGGGGIPGNGADGWGTTI